MTSMRRPRQATTKPGNIYQFKKVSQTCKIYFHW